MLGGGKVSGGEIEVKVSTKYDDSGLDKLSTDLKKADRGMDSLGKSSTKTGGKLKSGLKAGAVAGGAALVAGLAAGFKVAYTEAREAEKVMRQTEAVLKSTGGAANVTAGDLDKLSTSISNKIGVDDEAIQSGANLLLTFKDIKNEAGAGNDIFNQTTMAMMDMSAAMGQSTKSSAIQLGKALNDPIKGLSSLSRVGVQFTDDQKTMIESLVESGDKMAAQKIILQELNSQFAGSAAAATNPVERLKVIMNNLAEDIGKKLLPYIDQAADWLGKFVEQFINGVGPGGEFKKFLQDMGTTLKNLWPLLQALGGTLFMIAKAFASLPKEVQIAIVSFVSIAAAAVKIYAIVKAFQASATAMKVFAAVARVLPLSMGPLGIAIVALAVAAFLIYKNWDKVSKWLKIAWEQMKISFQIVSEAVIKAAKSGFLGPVAWIIANWTKVKTFFSELPEKILGFFKGLGGKIAKPFIWAFDKIKTAVEGIKDAIEEVKSAASDVGGFVGDAGGAVKGVLGFSKGGRVGPNSGGPQMFVAGEGGKDEWVISQEGDRGKNVGYLAEAASALGVGFYKNGGRISGRVRGAETRLARAEMTKGSGDDIRAVTELRNIYRSAVGSLDKKLKKNRNGRDWFDRKFSAKQAGKRRNAALDNRLSYLGSWKQYQDQLVSLRQESAEGASVAEQINAFNSERFALLSGFTGNIRARAGALSGASPRSSLPSGSIPSPVSRGSEGTTVQITQNYTEPPSDPHAWTRNIQNEVAALV
jgi:hypothetical protein